MSKKVLFCGGGNMAEGVLRSVLKKGPSQINPCRNLSIIRFLISSQKSKGTLALIPASPKIAIFLSSKAT